MEQNEKEKTKIKPNQFHPLLALLVILLAFVCWMNFGPMLSFGLMTIEPLMNGEWKIVGEYLVVHVPFLLMFLALLFGCNFVLKTSLRQLISGATNKYRYGYSFAIAGIYLLYLALSSLISFKTISIDPVAPIEKLRCLLPVLILTPIQAISEEIFFRALPARIAYKDELPDTISSSIPIVLVSGMLFLIPHLANREMSSSFVSACIYYFLWGAAAMALSIYTRGFEAPIAMHIANNLYIALIVNYKDSSLPSHAIFINSKAGSNAGTIINTVILFMIVFAFSYYLKRKKSNLIERPEHAKEKEED